MIAFSKSVRLWEQELILHLQVLVLVFEDALEHRELFVGRMAGQERMRWRLWSFSWGGCLEWGIGSDFEFVGRSGEMIVGREYWVIGVDSLLDGIGGKKRAGQVSWRWLLACFWHCNHQVFLICLMHFRWKAQLIYTLIQNNCYHPYRNSNNTLNLSNNLDFGSFDGFSCSIILTYNGYALICGVGSFIGAMEQGVAPAIHVR